MKRSIIETENEAVNKKSTMEEKDYMPNGVLEPEILLKLNPRTITIEQKKFEDLIFKAALLDTVIKIVSAHGPYDGYPILKTVLGIKEAQKEN